MEVKTDKVKLAFESAGSPDVTVDGRKPPIILLHGLTSAKETWKNVMFPIAVATGRKVYAYDARNHGDSGWSDSLSYDNQQEDLLEFMNCLRMKRAILIGHSMGGKVAMLFARKWPDRVEQLIVEDISPKPSSGGVRGQVHKYIRLLNTAVEKIPNEMKDLEEAKNFVNNFLQESIPEHQRSSRHGASEGTSLPLTQDENGSYRWKTNLKSVVDTFMAGSNSSFFYTDDRFPGPTLILYGTKSPYNVLMDKDFILEMFPEAEFKGVEGATHQIHLEYQDIFLKEVVDFINSSSRNKN